MMSLDSIFMDDHPARMLTQELIGGSDMIVVMEVEHLHWLQETYLEIHIARLTQS